MEGFWNRLNNLISEDVAHRGISDFASVNELKLAAELSISSSKVAIFTGFTIMPLIRCETDGPLGAIFLARAFTKLGRQASIWTDDFHVHILEKGRDFVGLDVPVYGVPLRWDGKFFCTFWEENFNLLISIERPGRALDGKYYSFRNEDISHYVSPLDEFFIEAKRRKIPTIGIGDGGNEIGMGNIRRRLLRRFPEKWKMFSVTKVDSVIVSGVSNWGAYGLIAALAKLLDRWDLVPSPGEEKALLRVIVECGGVDGVTLKQAETVDGIAEYVLSKKLKEIANCLEEF